MESRPQVNSLSLFLQTSSPLPLPFKAEARGNGPGDKLIFTEASPDNAATSYLPCWVWMCVKNITAECFVWIALWGNGDGRFSHFPEAVEENEERNRNKDGVCFTVACYPSVGTMSQNSIRQNSYTNHSVLPPNDNKQHFNSHQNVRLSAAPLVPPCWSALT